MKDNETFSDNVPPPTTSASEPDKNTDGSPLSSPTDIPQDTLTWTDLPLTERQRALRRYMRLGLVLLAVLVILAGGYDVFRVVSPIPHQASSAFQQAHCPFPLAGLIEGQNVKCGFLTVPEDRSQPQGPTIRLAVAIFKASSPHPLSDPILVLGGGPGMAILETQGPKYNVGNLPPNRDLILLDQRGVGYSQPSLHCFDNETAQMCHDRLVKLGINLNAFTTLENAADVHDLIRTLGYRQVNLDGTSYGTRLALTVMRLYPADLRSVILNSVIPPRVNAFISIPQAGERAFNVLFQGCMADSSCNTSYPHLQTVFYQQVTDLNTTPITFQATSASGKLLTVHFTGDTLVQWLRDSLYSTPIIPLLPRVIFQIRQHDYTLLSRIYGNRINDTMNWGLFYSMMCGEDGDFTSSYALRASTQGLPPQVRSGLLGISLSLFFACQFWGEKTAPALQKEPVTSSIPTLILQGEYDPVTPPANGMLAAQTLSKSYFFLFPGLGHGVYAPNSTCPDDITHAFLENPTEKPDASCIKGMGEPVFV